MVKQIVVLVAAFAVVTSGAYAVSLQDVPFENTTVSSSSIRGVAVDANGDLYVAGTTKTAASVVVPAYWKMTGGAFGAPIVLPTAGDGEIGASALGIGVLANGDVVVSSGQNGGLSDWRSTPGAANNGWTDRMLSGGLGQATRNASQNALTVAADGVHYYQVGRNGASDKAAVFYADGATGAGTSDEWSGSGLKPMGVSRTGVAAYFASNRVWYKDSTGTHQLPGFSGRTDAWSQAQGISGDGKTIVGDAKWSDAEGNQWPAFWDLTTSTQEPTKLGLLPTTTTTTFAYAVDEDGSVMAGMSYMTYPDGVNRYAACYWDRTQLDSFGRPAAHDILVEAKAAGVAAANWFTLDRAYSVTPDGRWVTGDGQWDLDGNFATTTDRVLKGFAFEIPEPATLSFLALGGLALLRRRH